MGVALALACGVALAFALASQVQAATGIYAPMSYQGKLTNTAGNAITNGAYNVRFKIFDSAANGTLLWTETWDSNTTRVTTTGGLFSVLLGTHVTMTGSVDFNSDSLFLQVEFDPGNDGNYEEVFTPRRRFASVPYAHNADLLDGRTATKFVWNDQLQVMSGTLIIRPRDASKVGLSIESSAGSGAIAALKLSTQGANHITFGSGAANYDTNLYRKSAAVLRTDGAFWAQLLSGAALNIMSGNPNYILGNLGIGRTTANTKLDVVGTISGSALTVNGAATILTGGSNFTVNTTVFVVNGTSNNVGIGTASPKAKLDVVGTASAALLTINSGATGAN